MTQREIAPWVERASHALECWEAKQARDALEQVRSRAAGWGDADSVALAEVLLARVALLTSSEPAALSLPARELGTETTSNALLEAALQRLEMELVAAGGELETVPEIAPVTAGDPVDRIAALAISGAVRLRRGQRLVVTLRAEGGPFEADAFGWEHVVGALDAEARGRSGIELLERAIERGEREGRRALLWTALELRALLCERRSADAEALASFRRMRGLVERWALGLPATDAASALSRPDRKRLGNLDGPSRETSAASAELVEAVLSISQERNTERLVDLALDAALRITAAERGLLLLALEDGGQRVIATRHLDREGVSRELMGLSSSVARQALKEGEVVLSTDVEKDARFSECSSVGLGVTSVLCIPIHARGQIEGAIYLDRRSRGRPFDASTVAPARALGAMLASALLSSRTIDALEIRSKELDRALATRTVERDQMSRRLAQLEGDAPVGTQALIGGSPKMERLRRIIQTIAASDAPVLVAGETGSGKELVARAIHASSARRDQPFVAINCAALSENLLAAELFGSERGAFTGASSARPGLFAAAHRGTLFLDEVGDMPPAMQKALLRALETSEVRAVGATQSRRVDVRVVAASHRDLIELGAAGSFREDLRFRLEVVRIEVPPLRDRLDDLPELCEVLVRDARERYNLPQRALSTEALEALRGRHWAGNVRELRHVLTGAALNAHGPLILPEDLPPERSSNVPAAESLVSSDTNTHALRADSIRRALKATQGHRGRAAKILGISRSTLYRYCEAYRIEMTGIDRASSG
jgi:DNA-binding NtrC family response regulator